MQRQRSNGVDYNTPAQGLSHEDRLLKKHVHSFSGSFLNFAYDQYIQHDQLDKTKIRQHVSGFAHHAGGGIVANAAKEPLIRCLGAYLTPVEFANLRLVCKPQI